jgi:hypothetical protein
VRKRGRCCCCCFQGVVWARVAVVVIISLYILYTTQKRIRSRVFFWCVFGELFLARDFFFSLFFVLFSSKTQQTRSILDRHTLQNNARPKLCVCVCACLWCDCRLKGTI